MHHHKMYLYINFQQNRVKRSVITVHTSLFAKKSQVAQICNYQGYFPKNLLFQTCIIVKRRCMSIFGKFGLVDQSKPWAQIFLQKIASCINLPLAIRVEKITLFGHTLPP